MFKKSLWAMVGCATVLLAPALIIAQTSANAAGTRKADWNPAKASKSATPKSTKKATPKAAPKTALKTDTTPPDTIPPDTIPPDTIPPDAVLDPNAPIAATDSSVAAPVGTVPALDQSQEVLDIDFAMASTIAQSGPKIGYGNALSEEGVLFDANGASPKGQEAATSRFAAFPADVSFVRTPEKAVAAGGSGSSWGAYTIKRGETVLSSGRYISVWRREAAGWKMISELAAGRNAPGATPAGSGVLPKRPAQLGRAAPTPVGVPLTIPATPAPPAATAQTPPTP